MVLKYDLSRIRTLKSNSNFNTTLYYKFCKGRQICVVNTQISI